MPEIGQFSIRMVAVIGPILCSWFSLFCAGKSITESSCRLEDMALQQDFDLKRFQGKWYATQKLGAGDSVLSFFTEIYDARIVFKLNSRGGFDIKAAGSKFYGSWCPKGQGHAAIPSPAHPERLTMFFDTKIGRQVGMKPGWILATDYENYAVIYSCWSEQESGECHPSNTYVAVLQRKTDDISPSHRVEIDRALRRACVEPKKLSKITHYGYCLGRDGL